MNKTKKNTGRSILTDRNTLAICATRARKILSDTTVGGFFASRRSANMKGVYGRSMIEMLGVLAIIGVLSAGGVWGYSVAMENYRANQIIQDIYKFTAQAIQFFRTTPNKDYISMNGYDLCHLGMIEEKYCKTLGSCVHGTSWDTCLFDSALGKKTAGFLVAGRGRGSDYPMTISGKSVTAKGPSYGIHPELYGISDKICVKLLTHNWSSMGGFLQHAEILKNGTIYYRWLPMSLPEAQTLCKNMHASTSNRLGIWTWIR